LVLAIGCEPTSPPDLASLESLAPAELEPGEELVLTGSGFIQGRADLVLSGTLSAPGRSQPRLGQREIVLPVLVNSSTSAVARIGRHHLEELGAGHTTFVGRAVLRFPTSAGEHTPHITASLDSVRLELFADPSVRRAGAWRVQERGEAVLEDLGIAVAILPEGRGLLIERVASGSSAEVAGLRAGEVVVSSGTLTVASVADLAPPQRSRHVLLGVRDLEGRFRRVSCHLGQTRVAPDSDRIASLAIGGCAMLVLLVAAGPLRGPFRAVGDTLLAGATGPRDVLRRLCDDNQGRPARTATVLLVFAAAPFVVMSMAGSGLVVVAGVVLLTSIIEALHSSRGWQRLEAAWRGVWRGVPLVAGCAVAAARAASIDLDTVVSFQGAVPWAWNALSDPACLALFVLIVVVTCAREGESMGPSATLFRGLAGALVAAVFLGGWSLGHPLFGQIVFAIKSWTVGLCLASGGRVRFLFAVPFALLAGAGALALMVFPVPDWTGTAGAWIAGTAAVFWVLPLWVKHAARPPRSMSPPARVVLHPEVVQDLPRGGVPRLEPGRS
jgi:hypothetical protein